MISIGREFRTSAVCSVPPQGCEDVGAGQQWPLEELWPCGKYTTTGKIQSSPRVWSSWDGCLGLSWLVCSDAQWAQWLYGNASGRHGDARVILLKDTKPISSPGKIINLVLCTPEWMVYPVDKTIYAFVSPYENNVEENRGYCFTTCRYTIYLVFLESIHFFFLDFFFPSYEMFYIKSSG